VNDHAGPGTPELRPAGRDAEGGRGLQLVAGLAARRADGDLVRAVAPLLMSPPGDWAQIYLSSTWDVLFDRAAA